MHVHFYNLKLHKSYSQNRKVLALLIKYLISLILKKSTLNKYRNWMNPKTRCCVFCIISFFCWNYPKIYIWDTPGKTKTIIVNQRHNIPSFNPIPYVSGPDVPATAPSEISRKSDMFMRWLNNFPIVFEQIVFVHEKALVL